MPLLFPHITISGTSIFTCVFISGCVLALGVLEHNIGTLPIGHRPGIKLTIQKMLTIKQNLKVGEIEVNKTVKQEFSTAFPTTPILTITHS